MTSPPPPPPPTKERPNYGAKKKGPDPEAQFYLCIGMIAGAWGLVGANALHTILPTPFGLQPVWFITIVIGALAVYWVGVAVKREEQAKEEAARKSTEAWLKTEDGKRALAEIDRNAAEWMQRTEQ